MKYKQNGFAVIGVIAIIAALLILGGVWYYYANRAPQSTVVIPTAPASSTLPGTPTSSNTSASSTSTATLHLFQAATVPDANNQFATDLYMRYAGEKNPSDNIFFSPFSISSAVAMVYEGAKGQTATEIANVFHFPANIADVRSGYQSAFAAINSNSGSYTLSTANALWVQNNYQLLGSYTNAVKTYYGGSITDVDFINDPTAAVSTINRWVADRTANKIQNILSTGDITQSTRLILTNAIYFKGAWSSPFDVSSTHPKNFTTSGGDSSQVPMMEQTSNFSYADVGGAQLLRLPYNGNDVSMFVLLPKGNNLSGFENGLNYQTISGWEKEAQFQLVDVSFPKFKIETEEHMPPDLEAMGMPTAFSPSSADFSGIAPIKDTAENLYIGNVIHKAFIDTDEYGTEAAAATAIVMSATDAIVGPPPRPVVFNANHPFVFFIQENQTGNILFIGRVVKP
jgi:serpin B